jgi:hypothetical protein
MLEKYYRILGISADADDTSLKKAFRKLALKLHPDVNNSPDANVRFQELCEAYEVLLRHIKHQTTIHTNRHDEPEENGYSYEDVIREARAAASARARVKYEKMKAEKEIFEQSGWREVFLFFNYAGRFLAIPLAVFLIVIPIYVAIIDKAVMFFALAFLWIIGGFLILYIYSSRKTWFRQGKFRWKAKDFFKLFDFSAITDSPTEDCFYCKGEKADAKAHTVSFHKIRDIILQNNGVYQHTVAYKRKVKDLVIPRSAKARKVHFFQSVIKISSLIVSLIFVPFPDFIWRFIFGLFLGVLLSTLYLWMARTRSKVSYLLNYFLLIKVTIWMLVIISQSTLYPGFILESQLLTPFYLVILFVFGDMILDLVLKIFPFYDKLYLPLIPQGPVIEKLFKEGYQSYMDVPVWSTVYPLFVWLF